MISDKEIDENLKKLWHLALNMTRNEEDAKDLLQETAIKAFINKDKYDEEFGKVTTWLATILKNIYIDSYRKKQKRNIFVNDSDINDGKGVSDYMIIEPNKNGGYHNIKYKELIIAINKALANNVDRDLFLKQLEGYKLKELSDMFGLNINTVKGRLRNTKIELQKYLEEHGITS